MVSVMKMSIFYSILILVLTFSLVPVVNSQQTCIQPASGMVSWWSGDGDCKDFYDINNGMLYNGASFDFGKVWQAFRFDGVDDYLLAPGEGINGLQQITIEGWVYLNSLPNRIMRFVTCSPPNLERAVIRYGDFNDYAGQLHFYMRIGDENADFTHLWVPNVLFS
jgi:hypothetical protein